MAPSQTRDATACDFRVAGPGDEAGIRALYAGLSERSSRMRFSTLVSEEALTRAAALGPDGSTLAVVAVLDGELVGEARIGSVADDDHEFAVTVADHVQHRGVGAALVRALQLEGRRRGLTSLRAVVRADNAPMLSLLRKVGGAIVEIIDAEVLFDIATDEQMPGWNGASAGQRVLVETRSFAEHPVTTALRRAGFDIRQCGGPGRGRADPCPLVTGGRCRLADEADVIACLLPETDPATEQIVSAHRSRRPDALLARSVPQWQETAGRLAAHRLATTWEAPDSVAPDSGAEDAGSTPP